MPTINIALLIKYFQEEDNLSTDGRGSIFGGSIVQDYVCSWFAQANNSVRYIDTGNAIINNNNIVISYSTCGYSFSWLDD